ncbi:hypothetical protein ABNO07_003527 [Salmonella enterica subsp. enterica serovar Bareilly]
MDNLHLYGLLCAHYQRLALPVGRGIEKHHITPRHAGGTDDPANLVNLPFHIHLMAHLFYAKGTGTFKAWQAVKIMITQSRRRITPEARPLISEARNAFRMAECLYDMAGANPYRLAHEIAQLDHFRELMGSCVKRMREWGHCGYDAQIEFLRGLIPYVPEHEREIFRWHLIAHALQFNSLPKTRWRRKFATLPPIPTPAIAGLNSSDAVSFLVTGSGEQS